MTFAIFDTIKDRGLKIPDDVAIVGFTDNDTAIHVTPKLTVAADNAAEQGRKACELLMRVINGDKKHYKEIVPMDLIIRESSNKRKKQE